MQVPDVRPALILFEAHIAPRKHIYHLMANLRRAGYYLDCCSCPLRSVSPLYARNPANASRQKVCDSGNNAFAWLPSRLNLTAAVARHPNLLAWYARKALIPPVAPPQGRPVRRPNSYTRTIVSQRARPLVSTMTHSQTHEP